MPFANPYAKQLRIGAETVWGTPAPQAGATILRRVKSNFNLRRDLIDSNEKHASYQKTSSRHGPQWVEGTINGELSPGTYATILASLLRNTWQTAPTTGALITIGTTATGSTVTWTRSAGSFLADGFKIGMVVRATGYAAPATANNGRNVHVTAVTATTMTGVSLDGADYVAKAAGDSVTIVMPGRHTFIPATGHLDPSFSFEEWYPDVPFSDLFVGCKAGGMNLSVPASGVVTADFDVMGRTFLDRATIPNNAEYFTTPTGETLSDTVSSSSGVLIVQGTPLPLLTAFSMAINGNLNSRPVAFSSLRPYMAPTELNVSGTITPILTDQTLTLLDLYRNEIEGTLSFALAASKAPGADVIAVSLPRIKINTEGRDEEDTDIPMSMDYQALENLAGGGGMPTERTTILIQDTSLV